MDVFILRDFGDTVGIYEHEADAEAERAKIIRMHVEQENTTDNWLDRLSLEDFQKRVAVERYTLR